MDIPQKKQRTQGKKTCNAILIAATELFVANGFHGASMGDIAKQANVNSALLYHHFANKASLWKAVKNHVLTLIDTLPQLPELTPDIELKVFITALVKQRITLYQNVHIRRLIQWQLLEDAEELYGGTAICPSHWLVYIKALQAKQAIRQDWTAEAISLLIHGMLGGALLHSSRKLTANQATLQQYQTLAIEALLTILAPTQITASQASG